MGMVLLQVIAAALLVLVVVFALNCIIGELDPCLQVIYPSCAQILTHIQNKFH